MPAVAYIAFMRGELPNSASGETDASSPQPTIAAHAVDDRSHPEAVIAAECGEGQKEPKLTEVGETFTVAA
ncbi:hypothetical protein [Sulfitobacter sp. DSM 110093]|uniref:hypothetical protein n=1 Tax=Sulfitobacter sp. DSM 110093 TaxID=2883127 RepID=UPI001FAB5473|nr:hypothetical protein [Sulfitobacter sp. DSM 110093]